MPNWEHVKQLIAGTGISLDPTDGKGEVTITNTGGGGAGVPAGVICMWSGLLVNIPVGWVLCNGSGGTPDLRSCFIKGAAAGIDPGATGGAATHTHDDHPALIHAGTAVGAHSNHVFTQPTSHPATATAAANTGATSAGSTSSTLTLKAHTHTTPVLAHSGGAVDAHSAHSVTQPNNHGAQSHVAANSEPAYYSLAFIMKT